MYVLSSSVYGGDRSRYRPPAFVQAQQQYLPPSDSYVLAVASGIEDDDLLGHWTTARLKIRPQDYSDSETADDSLNVNPSH